MVPHNVHICCSVANEKWFRQEELHYLFDIFYQSGVELKIVGGAIRNSIMGYPVREIDFATNALPDETIRIAHQHKFSTYTVGKKHGTIHIIGKNKTVYEVTTLRRDISTNGRHSVVQFGTSWLMDAQRRDFSMNALYADKNGNVYDYLGNGFTDCQNRIIRFIGDAYTRIQEDYLRAFRYFRFACLYSQGPLDQKTLNAIQSLQKHISEVSRERVCHELRIMLGASSQRLQEILWEIYDLRLLYAYGFDSFSNAVFNNPYFVRNQGDILFRLWMLFYQHRSYADYRHYNEQNVLSQKEKKRMNLFAYGKANCDILQSRNDLLHLVSEFEAKEAKDIVLSACAVLGEECARYKKYVAQVERQQVFIFPVTGQDLLQNGFKQGREIGHTLRYLKKIWINSDYTLTQKKLIKHITISDDKKKIR